MRAPHGPDDREDDRALARRLGVSAEAVAAVRACDVIDLHIDTFIPVRLWGYRIDRRHGLGALRGYFGGHLDLPRMIEGGLTGAMWSVTTNPLRPLRDRWDTTVANFRRLRRLLTAADVEIVASHADYQRAARTGRHAAILSIQGGNALDGSPADPRPDRDLLRVTLVHLTNSLLGQSSSPAQLTRVTGLTARGRALVERLDDHRIFVDLAHAAPSAFWDAVAVHDPSLPLLVTHTGVQAVTPHWRNLDDAQLRAVADSGGTIGIMFHLPFIRRPGARDRSLVLDHMAHVIDTVGEDFVSIGSDYDGAIVPPRELRSGDAYPRLVQGMLDRGWSTGRIEKVLGGNFLRTLAHLRP